MLFIVRHVFSRPAWMKYRDGMEGVAGERGDVG